MVGSEDHFARFTRYELRVYVCSYIVESSRVPAARVADNGYGQWRWVDGGFYSLAVEWNKDCPTVEHIHQSWWITDSLGRCGFSIFMVRLLRWNKEKIPFTRQPNLLIINHWYMYIRSTRSSIRLVAALIWLLKCSIDPMGNWIDCACACAIIGIN